MQVHNPNMSQLRQSTSVVVANSDNRTLMRDGISYYFSVLSSIGMGN